VPTLDDVRGWIINMKAHHREWIATVHGTPVCWVRLRDAADAADLMIVVAPERRGEHLATPIIKAACAQISKRVDAFVNRWNRSSKSELISAGFRVMERDTRGTSLRYTR
jgi:hypothetical protein